MIIYNDKSVSTTIQIREKLYEKFKTEIKSRGLTVTFVFNKMLVEFMERNMVSDFISEGCNFEDSKDNQPVSTSLQIREKLYEQFRELIKSRGLTITFVVNKMIADFLDQKKINDYVIADEVKSIEKI